MRDEYDFSKGKRGPVIPHDPDKVRINICLDPDIIEYFKKQAHKACGGDFRTMINNALREHIKTEKEPPNENKLHRLNEDELRIA
ncbi:BrnA antitoxin family protein [Desulfonema magnum]|uniref:Toxin-antitoxin system, antitoxin component, BrnA-like n=1 Tax=Desulfonema magnum TaxID=45655 RepID=A0A975BUM2_9BACT|nr:BrnA antitoxin family protein [Desulfonema magnum]QTA92044.1 Toxin-antitoxin system, antitoxin component, BrnA-like [Desulfonema magnum]